MLEILPPSAPSTVEELPDTEPIEISQFLRDRPAVADLSFPITHLNFPYQKENPMSDPRTTPESTPHAEPVPPQEVDPETGTDPDGSPTENPSG